MTTSDWRHQARCREYDPELFFPIGNTGPALLQTEEAKNVCYRCPVMDECGLWALETRIEQGVFGGMSEDERRAIRRRAARNGSRREAARCGTRPGYKRHHREKTPVCEPCAQANRDYANQRLETLKEAV